MCSQTKVWEQGKVDLQPMIRSFFRIRPNRRQKPFRLLRVKVLVKQLVSNVIDDADVHRVCMQVDSAVEFMLLFVEFHHVLLRVSGLEPRTIEVEAR